MSEKAPIRCGTVSSMGLRAPLLLNMRRKGWRRSFLQARRSPSLPTPSVNLFMAAELSEESPERSCGLPLPQISVPFPENERFVGGLPGSESKPRSWTADVIFEVQENRGPVFKSVPKKLRKALEIQGAVSDFDLFGTAVEKEGSFHKMKKSTRSGVPRPANIL